MIDRRDGGFVGASLDVVQAPAPPPKPKLAPAKGPSKPPPTIEQQAVYDAVRGTKSNIMVGALAGTGKTHVLEQVQLIAKEKPVLYLVFNKRNADEAADKMLSTTDCRTINSQGHRVWAAAGRQLGKPDTRKSGSLLREYINEPRSKGERDAMWAAYDQVVAGVNLAKNLGYVPDGALRGVQGLIGQTQFHHFLDEVPDDLVSDLIDIVLRKSIKAAFSGYIDYNDQIYMPALWGGIFPRFPFVMVDEYQDLSPVDHAFLARLTKSSRLIGVGDINQNIYGFRGASAGGIAEAIRTYSMTTLPLSISFRCPSEIVRHVHWHVPEFKAFKDGGTVTFPETLSGNGIPDNATFICRLNAPLFSLAFRMLANGHSVSVAGSEIGPRLIAIMRKLGSEDMTRPQTIERINEWEAEKLENESKTASDMAECMRIFARHGTSLGQAMVYAEHLFQQQGSIHLMTGHKAKGLEFPNVYHLDPYLCGDGLQDRNLRYVISTRSSDQLTEIDSSRISWG